MQESKDPVKQPAGDEHPPVLGTWRKWYLFVLSVLILQIVIYYLITNHFA